MIAALVLSFAALIGELPLCPGGSSPAICADPYCWCAYTKELTCDPAVCGPVTEPGECCACVMVRALCFE
jgi:hypothetical protein